VQTWVRLGYRILIFAGFLSGPAPGEEPRKRSLPRRVLSVVFGIGLWVITWVFPITFMIAMSWACENDTRTLGDRAVIYGGTEGVRGRPGLAPARLAGAKLTTRRRVLIRTSLLILSLAIPLGFITLAVSNPFKHAPIFAIAGLVGLAIVIALSVRAARY
jgi:hypothetical protein